MQIKNIGVIGAGTMGQGVAYLFAKYGYKVILADISAEAIAHAGTAIKNIARHDYLLTQASRANAPRQIEFTTDIALFVSCDFIIENVTEKLGNKAEIYRAIREIVREDAIVAVNTSAHPISSIAGRMKHAQQVLGVHFMNPAYMIKTAEVIRGKQTCQKVLDQAINCLKSVELKAVVVGDAAGFVSNRVLMLTINEAIHVLHSGIAEARDIDKIFHECLGHKMGPLEMADLIGLDTIQQTLEVLYGAYGDTKFQAAPLLEKMVKDGNCGRKTGQGFYNYS